MKKLKILYTIPNFDTAGSGKVVYDLVKGLDREKFTPAILVKHTRGAFFKEVEKLGVPIYVFDFETAYHPLWSFPFRLWKVIRFFKGLQVDMIHSWHWSSDFSEALAARLAGVKYVYTKKNMGWGNKAWIWKSKLSNQVVMINTSMKVVFFKKIKNTSYIPVGIDIEFYKPRPRTGRIKNINLNKKFVIISVANMVPVKGIETLIKAYLTLKNELNIDLALLLVGNCNGNYGQKLKILSKDDKDIYFFGKKKDVRPYLAEADVFVIPTLSKGEGQGVAPLEAMAMQIPVIASNVYGLKDIMKFQKNNLFKPGDVFDLKSKLECELLKKQNENFTKCILLPEEFHLKTMMKKYESLYQNILS